MTVSVNFSLQSAGEPMALPEDLGTITPGSASSAKNVFISHDGTAKIENCRLYILPFSGGVYTGSKSAQDDYDTVIGYGDNSYPATSGEGLYLNMNYSGSFPTSSNRVFRSGDGDSLANAITLSSQSLKTGVGIAGEIPAGGEAQIRLRLDIPATETEVGTSYVNLLMAYESTS